MRTRVPFDITKMDATIPEGIDLVWNGYAINSGPLHIQLDDQAHAEGDNRGELDYERNFAHARFNLRIDLSGVAKLLAGVAYAEPIEPIRAVLHSEGLVTDDHNFGLSGPMEFRAHSLVGPEGITATVLPGR